MLDLIDLVPFVLISEFPEIWDTMKNKTSDQIRFIK